MALYKINEFDADYKDHFEHDILGFDLYSGDDKVGSVDNLLVDEQGRFRYFVINTGLWIFGKKVLLPIGQARISFSDRRVYADSLTREQVEHLPEFDESKTIDYDHEEQVRGVYRPGVNSRMNQAGTASTAAVDRSPSLDKSAPLNKGAAAGRSVNDRELGAYDRNTYSYDRDPALYDMNEQNHQNLRLYEERLIANKTRRKTGEVSVGKHVETQNAHVSVPVEKERVVVERTTPTDKRAGVTGAVDFQEGEVARMEVYEETPDIRKEAFVREEVKVRKEIDRETVEADETLRREELDIDTKGNPKVNRRPDDRR